MQRGFIKAANEFAYPSFASFKRINKTLLVTRNLAGSVVRKEKKRPRVVILGSGWAGNTLARQLNKAIYDVRLISPANHFLFTPLLPSTAVGTLEFRAIQEPVRTIKGLGEYYQAKARNINTEEQAITCEDLFRGHAFDVKYDYLCIAAGNKTNTFQIPGVAEHENKEVFYLKHLFHARQIRNRILECFERAHNPNISQLERMRLLSFIVVGGGPTSCEFTAELYEFLKEDVARWYPDLIGDIKITLVEAGPGLLGSFDKTLADFYLEKLVKKDIDVKLGTAVTGVEDRETAGIEVDGGPSKHHMTVAIFADGTELPFGTMVWSAGLAPVKFIESSGLELSRGKVAVDEYLRVPGHKGRIFAMGDCSTPIDGPPLPPTATVAEQQGLYVGNCFNFYYSQFRVMEKENNDLELPLPGTVFPSLFPWEKAEFLNSLFTTPSSKFKYMNRGAMASMGSDGGVVDHKKSNMPLLRGTAYTGLAANLTWKAGYWTKQLSWSNMILIPMYWLKKRIFGRDMSRF